VIKIKIIDSHIHYNIENPHFDRLAGQSGHENTEAHLREAFKKHNIECAVVMGNRNFSVDKHVYPEFLRYCLGLHREVLDMDKNEAMEIAERHLLRDTCVGIKIYAGYVRYDLCDPIYRPFMELAEKAGKPVAVHMGMTASNNGLLKYSHPLQLDEAATEYPNVRFVMCHFGNPFLADAAAVLEKNQNVAADLSGLLVGKTDVDMYMKQQDGYIEQLRTWIGYVDDYTRFLYGTDWPLADIPGYIELTKRIIPEKNWEDVFYKNAKRVYGL